MRSIYGRIVGRGQKMSEGEEEEEKGVNERGIKEGVLCKRLKTERWMNRWMDG